ncbi:siroheme synthase CysG [Parvularcula maris]|uniref:Siroheme synthase CysG n=1 Tax=Parvularcula maris TaxID=2965077 RepID=A0A9X2LAT5_9PROT|nr:siroheme synthase CysG [Parvularcula maris]MCQ8186244.1 siroheme synthase CysG [Parvularcula maris]
MRYFPAFMDLQGRDVLVSGAGELAVRKARLLAPSGARLTFFMASDHTLAADEFADQARFVAGPISDSAFENSPALLIAATGDPGEDERAAKLGRAYGVPVNAVDMPELCDVVIPSIVERGDLVVGISTGGAAPVLGRRLRERLEAMLPSRLGDLVAFAKERRDIVAAKLSPKERRAFWERFFEGPARDAVLSGNRARAEQAFADELQGRTEGHVFIVGAGPGDPELLTLKALRVCQEADVILHDNLVSDEILALCRRDAERVYVGKKRSNHSLPQEAIGQLMVRLAREGKRVVRLKGGDPFIFGRGGEELDALKAAGVPATVVPGISAAMGCAASAELPLTYRGIAQSATFVTAEAGNGAETGIDWQALARLGGTIVVYMGVRKASGVAHDLIQGGLAPQTPVAVIADGTRDTERVIRADLGSLGTAAAQIEAPGLLVIGEVAAMARGEELIALAEERSAA